MKRIAQSVLAVLLGLWALYAIAANVVLRTRLLRKWIDTDEQKMKVEYASAWSWLPGRVHARGYSMRFQDSNVQFQLDIERVTLQIDPFALVQKRFHLTHVDADGTRFLFRHKLEKLEGNEARAAAFPHIEGFSDPPVRTEPPGPPIPDAQYHLWTIELEDVSTSLRELWVMEYRYRGAGSVAGGFRLKPVRELRVDPSALVTKGGVVSIGESPVLLDAQGTLEAHAATYDVREPKGVEVFGKFDARVDLAGELATVAPIGKTYLHAHGFGVDRGGGRFVVHARMNHGPLAEGSRVTWRSQDVDLRTPIGDVHGDVSAIARVEHGELVADVAVGSASLLVGGRDRRDAVRARDAKAHVDLGNDDVTKPFRLGGVSLSVASVAAPDLRALAPLAPQGVVLHGGSVEASGRASMRGDAIDARLDATLDDAHVSVKTVDVVASGRAWASVASAAETHATNATAGAELRGASVAIGKGDDARAKGLGVDVRASGSLAPSADLAVDVRAKPGDEVLHLVAGAASIPNAPADIVAGPDFQARGRIRAGRGGAATFDLLSAKDGKLDAQGSLRKTKAATHGAFVVGVGALRAGIEMKDGDVSVTPAPSDAWLQTKLR